MIFRSMCTTVPVHGCLKYSNIEANKYICSWKKYWDSCVHEYVRIFNCWVDSNSGLNACILFKCLFAYLYMHTFGDKFIVKK